MSTRPCVFPASDLGVLGNGCEQGARSISRPFTDGRWRGRIAALGVAAYPFPGPWRFVLAVGSSRSSKCTPTSISSLMRAGPSIHDLAHHFLISQSRRPLQVVDHVQFVRKPPCCDAAIPPCAQARVRFLTLALL